MASLAFSTISKSQASKISSTIQNSFQVYLNSFQTRNQLFSTHKPQ